MKILVALFMITSIMTVAGCAGNNKSEVSENIATSIKEGTFTNVDVNEAEKLIKQGIFVIDVRTPEEYKEGHIPEAQLIPLQEIEARINEFSQDNKYLIVCRSGNRSAQASDILVQKGMKNIYNMVGGMNEWTGEVVTE